MTTAISPTRGPRTASYRDEEIDLFVQRVADILTKPGAFESFCERIDKLLAKADAFRS